VRCDDQDIEHKFAVTPTSYRLAENGIPLAGSAEICETPAAILSAFRGLNVFRRPLHSNRCLAILAVATTLLGSSAGCATWHKNKEYLHPNHYRDERAVDIDKRLDRSEPFVKNPF
jgi:hypothetical protein